jgi:DNA-binding response OmpR family regulator
MEVSSVRVLIAEDEPAISLLLAEALHAEGYATTVVADGLQALEKALSGDFDLVVLDIGLPAQDGLTVLHELRGRGSSVPVLILTAMGSPRDTVTGLYAGADDYISKPFDLSEVVARIRARLRDHRGSDFS